MGVQKSSCRLSGCLPWHLVAENTPIPSRQGFEYDSPSTRKVPPKASCQHRMRGIECVVKSRRLLTNPKRLEVSRRYGEKWWKTEGTCSHVWSLPCRKETPISLGLVNGKVIPIFRGPDGRRHTAKLNILIPRSIGIGFLPARPFHYAASITLPELSPF